MKNLLATILLTCGLCGQSLMEAQNDRANGTTSSSPLDFSKDPCGNPTLESNLWEIVEGQVTKVLDGRTVSLAVRNTTQTVRVQLVGVSLEQSGSYSEKARGQLRASLLNKSVEILVNPSKWEKRPRLVLGMIRLPNGANTDVASALLSNGLARFETPPPYDMPNYTQCQYRRAEAEAHAKRLGLWGGL